MKKTYVLSMLVEAVLDFENDAAAIEYIENHTVFDLLDRKADVSCPRIIAVNDGAVIYGDE
jgi:hypothetical protein